MRGRQRRRRLAACLAGWIVFAAAAPPAGGAFGEGTVEAGTAAGPAAMREAAAVPGLPSAEGGSGAVTCEKTIDCGPGCTAKLQVGFCSLVIKWKTRIEIGPVQIGPALEIECNICDCWYTYNTPWDTTLFKRVSSAGCGGSLDGVEIHTV